MVRCLSEDIAVADGKWELRGVLDKSGKPIPTMEGQVTLVLKRTERMADRSVSIHSQAAASTTDHAGATEAPWRRLVLIPEIRVPLRRAVIREIRVTPTGRSLETTDGRADRRQPASYFGRPSWLASTQLAWCTSRAIFSIFS